MCVQAGFARASMEIGDAPHKTFCKEVSGKKVVDVLFHKVRTVHTLLCDHDLGCCWRENIVGVSCHFTQYRSKL